MNILIIGQGGREHALSWQCAKSENVDKVYVAPGNAGTLTETKVENVNIAETDINSLINFAKNNSISLTIVGPEAPLVLGIVDEFQKAGLKIFGPTKNASQLEGSKAFSKDFLLRHNIPTANYGVFSDVDKAKNYIKEKGCPIVIKADGLAAGKGVIIAENQTIAYNTVEDILANNKFGKAGSKVVIEEFLTGEEASFIVMVDGKNILAMASSQDHKARDDGDKGPNTGGMGAYSPAPIVDDMVFKKTMDEIIKPTVKAMAEEGNPYTGFLYAGLMIDENSNIKVLEFNCRFGDPETQPIMMRLKSDLTSLCLMAVDKKLDKVKIEWSEKIALGVVLAAKGYPDKYSKGDIIKLPKDNENLKIFHAGTIYKNNKLLSNGGRVLCATALGEDIKDAQSKAYNLANKVIWDNKYYRRDIGNKAFIGL